MSNSPEIDCNCDELIDDGKYIVCRNCGRVFKWVSNGIDDYDLEEVSS